MMRWSCNRRRWLSGFPEWFTPIRRSSISRRQEGRCSESSPAKKGEALWLVYPFQFGNKRGRGENTTGVNRDSTFATQPEIWYDGSTYQWTSARSERNLYV